MKYKTFQEYILNSEIYDKHNIGEYTTILYDKKVKKIDDSWEYRDHFYVDYFDLKDVWEYQQKRIEELEKENIKQKQLIFKLWELEPEKTEMLDIIQKYLKSCGE